MPSNRTPVVTCGMGSLLLFSLLCLSLREGEALARGVSHGLHWGYHPPAGNPLANLWLMTNPWSAMSGGAIPHHNLGPANLNMAYGSGSRQTHSSNGMLVGHGTYGSFGGAAQSNHSAMFPGSSSQTSSTTYSRPTSGYAPTYSPAQPGGSYRSEPVFQPPYYHNYNDYWHHGYWCGGQYGWSHWDPELGRLGFPRWGVGPLYYDSGYGSYQNPFVAGDERLATYAALIELDDLQDSSPQSTDQAQERVLKSPAVTAGMKAFDAAREAFRKRDFAAALSKVDESLESLPNDPALHEFRGLVLFAQGEYRQAAAVVYAVLAVSPGWDWTTLSSLYADQDEYTQQLRKLETYRKQNTEAPEAAFLVAYHYATCGHHELAVKHLHNVVKLLPNDSSMPHLVTLLSNAAGQRSADKLPEPAGTEPDAAGSTAAGPKAAEEKPESIDGSNLVGTWHASRGTGVRFELTLQKDSKFAWVVESAGESQRIEGVSFWSGNQLLLSSGDGILIGVVTMRSLGGGFNFRLLENAPVEAGLDFDR